MYKAYIADDELVVRQGLKLIVDWEELGFDICGEASDGLTAYNEITTINPDIIVVDIHMPKLKGLELSKKLREDGYQGKIIVLSGYSEFKYAQEAIMYDVEFYLTKPIDEEELKNALISIRDSLIEQEIDVEYINYFQKHAKYKILDDIIKNKEKTINPRDYSYDEIGLSSDSYQVLIIKKQKDVEDVNQLFSVDSGISLSNNDTEIIKENEYDILLLKGSYIINRFNKYQKGYSSKELKPYFIAVGSIVRDISKIYESYDEAYYVLNRSFFSKEQKILEEYSSDLHILKTSDVITADMSRQIGKDLYSYITTYNVQLCDEILDQLCDRLNRVNFEVKSIKNFLAGMYIYIVQQYRINYANYNVEFNTNAENINLIQSKNYLYEIINFFKEEIRRMIFHISDISNESVLEVIANYILHNYQEDIKLKTIAPRFGYNSSYLGKIFRKKYNINFNDYLHQVRIDKAKKLLINNTYKVYDVSKKVGYSSVDYFYIKFKQFCGCSPKEYRNQMKDK